MAIDDEFRRAERQKELRAQFQRRALGLDGLLFGGRFVQLDTGHVLGCGCAPCRLNRRNNWRELRAQLQRGEGGGTVVAALADAVMRFASRCAPEELAEFMTPGESDRCEVCGEGSKEGRELLGSPALALTWWTHADCHQREYGEPHPRAKKGNGDGS